MTDLEEGLFKILKDSIYEHNPKTKALVIYAIEEKAWEIHQHLNVIEIEEKNIFHFIEQYLKGGLVQYKVMNGLK